MQPRQTHANTNRHDDPCDDWQPIGDYVRLVMARAAEKQAQRERDLLEFCALEDASDNDDFIMTYTRFGG
jgi:hypothetical protein|tara:strand:- start:211 stop:420 length:210 start_codon:yes stop_codon:yes gene_type:complete